jgi:hypothetical protein
MAIDRTYQSIPGFHFAVAYGVAARGTASFINQSSTWFQQRRAIT